MFDDDYKSLHEVCAIFGKDITEQPAQSVSEMTGRDLITYILENKLEDEPVFKNGKPIGFMTVEEAAIKFGVGVSAVKTWFKLAIIDGVKLGDTVYIPANEESPIPRK